MLDSNRSRLSRRFDAHPAARAQSRADDRRRQLDVAHHGPREHADRCGRRLARASRRDRAGPRRRAAGAGTGHARARRSHRRVGGRRGTVPRRQVPKDAVARARREVAGGLGSDRRRGDCRRRRLDACRRPHAGSRPRSPVLLAPRHARAVLRRPGAARQHGMDSLEPARRPDRLPGLPAPRSRACAGPARAGARPNHRQTPTSSFNAT